MRLRLPTLALTTALTVSLLVTAAGPAGASLPPSEWVVGPDKPVVMLTLDGQMRAGHLTDILATLEEKRAVVTFFISGGWIKHHEAKARAITLAGHSLANRGYGTKSFTDLSDDVLRASIARAAEQVNRAGGDGAPFLRAPRGDRDLRVLRIAGSMGYRSVRWTYRAGGGLAKKVAKKVKSNLQAGAIVSLDPWRASHRQALPAIIDGVRNRGFGLRSVEPLSRTHAVRWDVTLKSGSGGPEVAYLQKKLGSISYPAGKADGSFGYSTLMAVQAFEKVQRLTRDGVVTPHQMSAISVARRPRAPKKGPRDFIAADISRQVVFEVRNRKVTHTTPMSSGNEANYTVDGQTYRAHTPQGEFIVERKIAGKRVSRLGTLWDPSYFIGGYAFHGSDSVPVYPASHGCIRLPMYVSRPFFDRNPVGMPVFVYN